MLGLGPLADHAGASVAFQGSATPSASCTGGASYRWDFGDGASTTLQNPAHVYASAGTYTWTFTASQAGGSCTQTGTIAAASACPTPGTPSLSSASSSLTSGQSVAVKWSAATGLDSGGRYLLETSRDGFRSVDTSLTTRDTSAVIPTAAASSDFTLSVRVKAQQSCGTSATSNVLGLAVGRAAASFVLTREGPAWSATLGSAPPSAVISVRNVGALAGQLDLSASGPFFTVTPSLLIAAAGAEASVTVTATASAMGSTGYRSGLLTGTYGSNKISTPVSLTVVDSAPSGGVARAPVATLVFRAPRGHLKSPENYVGYERTENFASPGGAVLDKRRVYAAPAQLRLNHWALSGDWTVGKQATLLNKANGRIAYRFHARDLHLVMGPAVHGTSVRFRVFIDGKPPGAAHGIDVDDKGNGTVVEPAAVSADPTAEAHHRSTVRDRVSRFGRGGFCVHVRLIHGRGYSTCSELIGERECPKKLTMIAAAFWVLRR